MTRRQLEHVIRAAAGITGSDSFVVIGSQAVLGSHPDAPKELVLSEEVDIFTLRSADDATLIDGTIGEGSPFHSTFGYYAHGVGEDTATLPDGWRDRLVSIRNGHTGGATGLCLEIHDLAVSKLCAGREKDVEYLVRLFKAGLADIAIVRSRLAATAMLDADRQLRAKRLDRILQLVTPDPE